MPCAFLRALHYGVGILLGSFGLLLTDTVWGAVTFSISPSGVSNLYSGAITLQVAGLTNGETVVLDKYLDANTNRIIDSADWLVQSLRLTDGQTTTIAGVTNFNIPGDTTATNGSITANVSFPGGGFSQQIAGRYLYRISSASARFSSLTNLFTVTNVAYAQSFTGTVRSSGSNVPYAAVLLFTPPTPNGGMNPVGGTIANSLGAYTLKAPTGTYLLWAIRSNYVADLAAAPVLTIAAGATINTNLILLPATRTISGRLVDAANNTLGIPGISLFIQSTNNLVASGFSDAKGNFTIAATSILWKLGGDSNPLTLHGYLSLQNELWFDASTGSVKAATIALPKGTALIYGTVKDDQNRPLPNVRLSGDQDNGSGPYRSDATTDPNGNYVMAVTSGTWSIGVSSDSAAGANYVFPQSMEGTNITDGTAVPISFTGIPATNQISGYVRDNNNSPITNVGVYASATLNGLGYNQYTRSDATGHYAFKVPNGAWNVGLNCGGGSDSLNQLGFLCVNSQIVGITNNNGAANFIATLATAHIVGYVRDSGSNPLTNVNVYAQDPSGTYFGVDGSTDGSGYYSLNVANGTWNVGVSCFDGKGGLSQLGYLCINEQPVTISNSTETVNFTALAAPYQITGYVQDTTGKPITNVNVSANATINGSGYNIGTQTDTNGSYAFNVANGNWNVNVNCNGGPGTDLASQGYLCVNNQFVTISNASGTANFTVSTAPYLISGNLSDPNGLPLTNLAIYGYANVNGTNYNASGMTDTGGHYVIHVINGTWNIGVGCGGFNGLNQAGYLCVNNKTVNIANNNAVLNFTAPPASFRITGFVRDTTNHPVSNVNVYANSGSYNANSATDTNGFYSLNVASGSWDVNVDCNGLTAQGYACTTDQISNISNGNLVVNFTVHPPLNNFRPIITLPGWAGPGQFQFTFDTVTGLTYTIQYGSDLSSWFSWITVGGTGRPMTITDPSATIGRRFYRVEVAP